MFEYSKYAFFNRETKGGLILDFFSILLKSPKKDAKTYLEHYPSKEMILRARAIGRSENPGGPVVIRWA